jgi:hypothetical protein
MTHAEFIDSLQRTLCAQVGLASPRPFLVKWNDEDFGQRSLVVIARTAADAREIAENASGRFALSVQSL